MYIDQKSFYTAFPDEPRHARQLLEEFAEWLESKKSDEQYDWTDPSRCACAQFAKDIGRFDAWRA